MVLDHLDDSDGCLDTVPAAIRVSASASAPTLRCPHRLHQPESDEDYQQWHAERWRLQRPARWDRPPSVGVRARSRPWLRLLTPAR